MRALPTTLGGSIEGGSKFSSLVFYASYKSDSVTKKL